VDWEILDVNPLFVNPIAAINAPTATGDYHWHAIARLLIRPNNGIAILPYPDDRFSSNTRYWAVIDMGATNTRCTLKIS